MSQDNSSAGNKPEYTIPGKLAFGSDKQGLRADMIKAGCKFDGKQGVWVVPNATVYENLVKRLDAGPALLPQATVEPPVAAPVAMETTELKQPPAVVVQPPKVEASVDPMPSASRAGFSEKSGLELLKLKACRFAAINIQVKSPNSRRELSRGETEQRMMGADALVVRTVTEHTIINPSEYEDAKKLVGSLAHKLRKLGTRIQDGVIAIPLDQEADFDEARSAAREEAGEFNKGASHYRIVVNAIKLSAMVGEEELMARKLAYELRLMMNETLDAIATYDVTKIRQAAQELKVKAQALTPGKERAILEAAVQQARQAANTVAAATKNKGELTESVKRSLETGAIDSARMLLLDYAVPEEVSAPAPVNPSRFMDLGGGGGGAQDRNDKSTSSASMAAAPMSARFAEL